MKGLRQHQVLRVGGGLELGRWGWGEGREGEHGDTVPIYPDKEFHITSTQLFSPPLSQSLISRLWEVGPQLLYTNRP